MNPQKNHSVIQLNLSGMTCQACATRIEKVLNKKDFIQEANVNFANESVWIQFDAQQTNPNQLIEIIEKIGFQASIPSPMLTPSHSSDSSIYSHKRLMILIVLSLPFAWGMMGMLLGTHALMPPVWLQIVLASVVQGLLAVPFYRSAWASVRGGVANMDVLVVMGTTAIYAYSLVMVGLGHTHHVYFEASVMVITLVSLGKFLEEKTKRQSLNGLNLLLEMMPKQVSVWRDEQWQTCSLNDVQIHDRLRCVAGERIAADGVVLAGEAWADESHLTGESQPILKKIGHRVLAGSLISGHLEYRAEQLGQNTFLGDMMDALAQAQGSKAPMARLADKVAAVFVPIVLLIAVLTCFLTWIFLGNLSQAVVHAVAVLVVACPCALGLATPTAIMAGMGWAVREGIWFKNAAVLERMGQLNAIVLDKTGTLTQGKPQIVAMWVADGFSEHDLLKMAASVEQYATHPLAQAVVLKSQSEFTSGEIQLWHTSDIRTEMGQGVRGYFVDETGQPCEIAVGKPEFCGFVLPEYLFASENSENSVWRTSSWVGVSCNGETVGALALADVLKTDALETIQHLQKRGMDIYLLSGDRWETVDWVARQLGLDKNHVRAQQLPRDKVNYIHELKQSGQCIAMVGDGVNDAAALASADVGISLANATDVAQHSADVVLVGASLYGLVKAWDIARATVHTIQQNLFFAFIYNVLGIPLAALGFLNPVLAGAMMALSSVSVLWNALRLKRRGKKSSNFDMR